MKTFLCQIAIVIVFSGSSSLLFAEDPKLVELKPEDSALILLDRSVQGIRNEVLVGSDQRPPQVMVEYSDDPADDWTGVRWVFRFPLADPIRAVKQAHLYLWAQSSGSVDVLPGIELIDGGQEEKIQVADRTAVPIGNRVSFEYPSMPSIVELDVTQFVNEAIRMKCGYVTFRILALSEGVFESVNEKERLNFGGPINVWNWPENHAPALQLTWD